MNVVLLIIDIILMITAMLRIAVLRKKTANLHFVQILLSFFSLAIGKAIGNQNKVKGEQYDNSM